MNINFQGKRALVTGAGQGIGRAIAVRLAASGAEVVALSRTQKHLDSLGKEVPGIKTVSVDMSDWTATKAAVESIGPIDLLVNNAAQTSLQPFLDITPDNLDRLFNINVKGSINVAQVVAKGMVARKEGGAIVNVSSKASQTALQDHTAYCSMKAALDMVTKVMALELGPHKIRVNAVNPTVVMTEMGILAWSDPQKATPVLNRIPLGKFAEVDDVVNAVMYLLSDQAKFITGVTLPVDGGYLAV
jgi:L-xylulose reductase